MKPTILFFVLSIAASRAIAQVPTISSFSPISGSPGTSVTISGTNFSSTPANNIVYFGAVRTSVSSASSTSLSVIIPTGATFGSITVTVNGLTAYSPKPFNPLSSVAGGTARIDFATGTQPFTVILVDLDGDGKSDVAVANGSASSISVFRNTSSVGTINFAAKQDFAVQTSPRSVFAGDLDGDGKTDLVVTNRDAQSVSVFRNTSASGTISFASRIDLPASGSPIRGTIRDIDLDGKPDIVVVGFDSNTASIYGNQSLPGIISFAARVSFTTGAGPYSVAAGDIDGDGKPDLAIPNFTYATSSMSILRNTSTPGNISFTAKQDFSTRRNPTHIALGDLDGDGKSDVVVSCFDNDTSRVSLYRNTSSIGSLSFSPRIDLVAGRNPNQSFIADINGSGLPEIVTANFNVDQIANENKISVFTNQSTLGNLSFASALSLYANDGANSVAAGDIDGDGKTDILVANQRASNISALPSLFNILVRKTCSSTLLTDPLCWGNELGYIYPQPGDSAIVGSTLYVGAGEINGCSPTGPFGGIYIFGSLSKVDTFPFYPCFRRGTFSIMRSMSIDSSGVFRIQSNDSTKIPSNLVFSLNGSVVVDPPYHPVISIGGNWIRSTSSTFTPGQSKVVFTGSGVLSRNFYDLLINTASAITTVGSVTVSNELDVRDSLALRRQDTLFINKSDPSAFIGGGLVRRGRIDRGIGPTGRYRFESDSTYLLFSAGTLPTRVIMTAFPDSLPPAQNYVPFGGQVFVDPNTNTIRIIGVLPYRKWAIGIPRELTRPDAPPQFVKRVYDISGIGNTSAPVTLALRYEQSELQPGMDESTLTLFYLDTPGPAQIKASVKTFLEGPFNSGPELMMNTLRSSGILPSHFPIGFPIPSQAVDSVTVEIRSTPVGALSAHRGPTPMNGNMPNMLVQRHQNVETNTEQDYFVPNSSLITGINQGAVNLKTSQPAWLLTDGAIRSFYDTTKNFVEFDTTAGSYYLVIKHRNHLPIMSAAAQPLTSSSSTLYDFTTSQSQAWGTNPMKQVGTKFCMVAGDVNKSAIITAADANQVFGKLGQTGYHIEDVDLDGVVTAKDANLIFGNLNRLSYVSPAPNTSTLRNAEPKLPAAKGNDPKSLHQKKSD